MAALAVLIAAGAAAGQERKITRADLPAAVERTVVAQSQGATIRGFTEEKENGQVFYEVEMIVGGHTKDLLIDASGAVVAIEEQVALNALPAPVRAALTARAAGARILSVGSITKQGRVVAYQAHVEIGRQRSAIQVGPDGKPLPQEQ
jgi:threonine dehydrogenase-like Zn-dependent dehydrogenase